jgi:hypothetical protein
LARFVGPFYLLCGGGTTLELGTFCGSLVLAPWGWTLERVPCVRTLGLVLCVRTLVLGPCAENSS